jgi:4-hydroxy-4-methyl-2-oxoglutarate aldolase
MTTDEIIRAFLELGSPFVADGAQTVGLPERIADPGLRPLIADQRIAGTVVTCKIGFHPTPQPPVVLAYERAYQYAKTVPSPIIVMECGLGTRSPWGGGASRGFVHAGIAGGIIDGTIRDTRDVRAQGFQMFSRGISPDSFVIERLPEGYVGAETGTAITVGGVTVVQGDLVCADEDGVVFCRPDDGEAILAAARAILAEEEEIFRRWDAGVPYLKALGLD